MTVHRRSPRQPISHLRTADAGPHVTTPASRRGLPSSLCAAALLIVAVAAGCDPAAGVVVEAAETEPIRDVDFANVVLVDEFDREHRLVDGFAADDETADDDVGMHLVDGPEFSDADGDGSVEAAIVTEWLPFGGRTAFTVFVFAWEDDDLVQVGLPARGDYGGSVHSLAAHEDGFSVVFEHSPEAQPNRELAVLGITDGDLIQVAPRHSAANRCPHDPTMYEETAVPDEASIHLAPHETSEQIGKAEDFASVLTSDGDHDGDGWALARLVHHDGGHSCGWFDADTLA